MNYVTGYTQYSTTAAEQSGNYIALDIDATDDSSVTVEFIDSDLTTQADAVTFTDKASMVFRITDVDKQSLKITAHKTGFVSVVKTVSFSDLTLEAAG